MVKTWEAKLAAVLGLALWGMAAWAGEGGGPLAGKNIRERLASIKQELVTKFDKDGDGRLTGEERRAALEAARTRIAERLGVRPDDLPRFDQDGDGRLSQEEREALKEFIKGHVGELKGKISARFDKDGDGKLNEAEREAAREQFRQGRDGNGPRGRPGGQGRGVANPEDNHLNF